MHSRLLKHTAFALPFASVFFIASATSLLAQDAPKPPSTGDTLQGPKVPPAGLEGNRAFGKDGAMKDGQGKGQGKGMQQGSRPMAMRAYMQAVQSLDLGEEQRTSVQAAMDGFRTKMQAFEKESAPRLKEMQEARKNAPADQPVDPALKAKFQELEKARPNFESLMKEVDGMLNDEQRGALKVKVEEFKAKAASEMKRRNEGMKDGAKTPDAAAPVKTPDASGAGDAKNGDAKNSDGKKDDGAKKKSKKDKSKDKSKDDAKDGDKPAKDQPANDEPMNP